MKLTQIEKEEILLKQLRREVRNLRASNDPFWDAKLYSEQIIAYSIANWDQVRIDTRAKWKYRYVVESDLFGGDSKHLDSEEYDRQLSLIK